MNEQREKENEMCFRVPRCLCLSLPFPPFFCFCCCFGFCFIILAFERLMRETDGDACRCLPPDAERR